MFKIVRKADASPAQERVMRVAAVVAALAASALVLALLGFHPIEVYAKIVEGSLLSGHRLVSTLNKTIPLVVLSLGVAIAFKMKFWNIGAEGQFYMGAFGASLAAFSFYWLPAIAMIPLMMVSAFVFGGLLALIPAVLKSKFSTSETLVTLMLNYIATYFLLYLVNGPMQDPSSDLSQSALVPEEMKLTRLFGTYRLHSGIFLLLVVAVIMLFFWRTSLGYRIDLVGQGRKVATYAGLPVDRTIMTTMLISGLLSGLAGWIETFGIQYRILDGIEANYGDISNIIALLGELNPVGIIASALFFAVLLVGGASMQRMTDVPYSVVDVVQGLIIIFVVAKVIFQFRRPAWFRKPGARKEAAKDAQ